MRICFIAPKAYPVLNPGVKRTFGGAEVQLILFARQLAKDEELDVHIMVADCGQAKLEQYERIKVWKSLNFKDSFPIRILKFRSVMKRINADVYVQRSLSPFSGLICLYCKLLKRRFVYMVANDGETDMKHFVFKSKIRGFLAGLVFRYADLVITQNNYQSRNLSRYKIRPFVIKSSDIIGEPNDDNDSYALWVGRADSLKQPSIFLELARKNQENDFVMICPPSTHNPKLSDYIRHEAMDIGNLRFIPFVSFHQIDKYFQNAKIFVNTSSQEGFPHTFVQAAKNKAPILSLNVNPDNFIDEYNCGFCSRNDFQLMNRQFRQLYGDNELYNTMSLNVLRYAKLNHDNIINAGKLNKLIRSIT